MNPSKYGRPDQESWLSDRVWFVVLSGKRLWNLFHPTSCGDLRPRPPIKCTIAPNVFPRSNLHSNPYHLANSMKGPLVTNMPRKNKLVRVPCHFQSEHADARAPTLDHPQINWKIQGSTRIGFPRPWKAAISCQDHQATAVHPTNRLPKFFWLGDPCFSRPSFLAISYNFVSIA